MTAVLLVEDEADVRELIEEALAARRLDMRSAASDKEAYAMLERSARELALIIADINLGEGVTGFDVARRARQLKPDMKVIYITGHAAHLNKFGVEGAVMFPKPFRAQELADRILELLGG